MKSIYIASAFRGPNAYVVYRNVQATEAVMYELIEKALAQGTPVAVLCPHSMTIHFDRTFNDRYWLEATLEHLRRSDALLLLPNWKKSEGALGEREQAIADEQPVFFSVDEVLVWLKQVAQEEAAGENALCGDCGHPKSAHNPPIGSGTSCRTFVPMKEEPKEPAGCCGGCHCRAH